MNREAGLVSALRSQPSHHHPCAKAEHGDGQDSLHWAHHMKHLAKVRPDPELIVPLERHAAGHSGQRDIAFSVQGALKQVWDLIDYYCVAMRINCRESKKVRGS